MYSLTDLILLRDRTLKRADVEKILTLTGDVIKDKVSEGATVAWVGLCTFTYKKAPKTKKEAKEFEANPELAEGDKLRVIADDSCEKLQVKGEVTKLKKAARVSAKAEAHGDV